MSFFAGIDVGAVFTKAVLLGPEGIVSRACLPSGSDYAGAATTALNRALEQAGLAPERLERIAATGVGGGKVEGARFTISDISCHGLGVHYFFPHARTVIDIGGQATKVIRVDEAGRALEFVVSEKCAAGSGRFLQLIAKVLQINFDDIGPLSLQSVSPVEFTTACAVFAESEAVSRIAEGAKKEDILAGVHRALASKVLTLVKKLGEEREIAVTGGGACDRGLTATLRESVGEVLIPPEPLLTAALGAALIARTPELSAAARERA